MSSKCRCGGTPEHVPWKCPSSKCAICKEGGHWARYCPVRQCEMKFPTKTSEETPVKADETSAKTPVKTPEKTPPTPEKQNKTKQNKTRQTLCYLV